MEIIALSGYARSGKDEAAKVLVEEFGFTRVAFADKLRDFLYALNPIVSKASDFANEFDDGRPLLLQPVIDHYGWDGYKASPFGPEIRRLLQRLGTEAGRQVLGDNIWIDAALTGFDDDARLVVTDCRFPNEAEAIRERGGYIVRVTREGVGPAVGQDGKVHPSETSLDDWKFDYRISNDSTLETYRETLRKFMDAYGTDMYFKHVIGD